MDRLILEIHELLAVGFLGRAHSDEARILELIRQRRRFDTGRAGDAVDRMAALSGLVGPRRPPAEAGD